MGEGASAVVIAEAKLGDPYILPNKRIRLMDDPPASPGSNGRDPLFVCQRSPDAIGLPIIGTPQ
eukprot:scaffold65433_cov66-Phaeocystis_antarctica.AAC.3